jgi:hypothetical protein
MMTAIFTMLLGALGVGQALMDMGDQRVGLQAARRIFRSIDEGERCAPHIRLPACTALCYTVLSSHLAFFLSPLYR